MDVSSTINKNTNANSFVSPSNFSLYLIGAGIMVAIITTFLDTSKNTLVGTMVGYSIITSGFLILLSTVINNTKSNTFSLFEMLKNIAPFILIIGTIIFLTYNTGKYFNNISKGRVSNSYKTFSTVFTLVTLVEVILFYRIKNSKQFKNTSTIPIVSYWLIILVGIINFIVAEIISIDLAYFNTDG
jgi:hypothetical protein